MYRELWRHSYDMVSGIPLIMRREVMQKLEQGASEDELQAYLDEVGRGDELGRYYGMVVFDAHNAFHKGENPQPPIDDGAEQAPGEGETGGAAGGGASQRGRG